MSISLANKYRPTKFEDVSEQQIIRTTIQNQIKEDNLRSAYLFSGGAGTGKTTCARIVAKMINGEDSTPIEIDAASNNSVEDIRRISEQTKFRSMNSKYKIYILDEVHALSSNAFQAMLKLIEETPKGVIFIFCTTDPHKIPATILSRVQRFNFRRISSAGIENRLRYICDNENIKIDKSSLEYIAKTARGGMRDAITNLDKVVAYTKDIAIDDVIKILNNGVTVDNLSEFTLTLIEKDVKQALELVNEFYMSGIDMNLFLNMYFEFLIELQKYLILQNNDITILPDYILKKYNTSQINLIRGYIQKLYIVITSPKEDTKVMIEAWTIERCL